jgi:hypothetical protein
VAGFTRVTQKAVIPDATTWRTFPVRQLPANPEVKALPARRPREYAGFVVDVSLQPLPDLLQSAERLKAARTQCTRFVIYDNPRGSIEKISRPDKSAIVLHALHQPPFAIPLLPAVVIIAQCAICEMGARARSDMHVADIAFAFSLLTIDADNQVAQQMLSRPTRIEKTTENVDDRRATFDHPSAKICDGIVRDYSRETTPVAVIHAAGDADQALAYLMVSYEVINGHQVTHPYRETILFAVRAHSKANRRHDSIGIFIDVGSGPINRAIEVSRRRSL